MTAYRERRRACPACRGPMEGVPLEVAAEGTTIDICRPCGAAFLEYFDGEPAAIARALHAATPAPRAVPTDAREPECPDCQTALDARPYLDRGPALYRCGSCLAAFATRAQLADLAAWRPSEDPPDPKRRSAIWQWLDRLLRSG